MNPEPPQNPLPEPLFGMLNIGKANVPRQGAMQVVESLHLSVQTDGKHKGRTFSWIYSNDFEYIKWLCSHRSSTSNVGTMALVIYAEFHGRL